MRRRVARQQNEEGKDITFSKCLDCEVKEGPVEKVCMVEGCGKKITARGRCSTHYAQYRADIQRRGPIVGTTEPLFRVKPEALAERQKILAKRNPEPNGTKRVNVQFEPEDVWVWEKLRDRAKANRRDIRHEAFIMIREGVTSCTN
jgi:hypothetical protein